MTMQARLSAAEYFIDYAAGSDEKSGTSASTAWKHCPSDKQAQGKAAACTLQAGDQVLFKGGVRYYGSITPSQSGTAAAAIIYNGNSDNNFGFGPAILDGSRLIQNWKPCASAADVLDNSSWKNIYYADIAFSGTWQSIVLCSDKRNLAVAMSPNPTDPMFQDRVHEFYESKDKLQSNAAVTVYAGPGTWLNKDRPLVNVITPADGSAVISPIGDATIHVATNKEHLIVAVGVSMVKQHTAIKDIKVTVNKKYLTTIKLRAGTDEMQRFELEKPVKASDIGFNFSSAHEAVKNNFTAVRRVAAWDKDGNNVLEAGDKQSDGMSFCDPDRFVSTDANYYDGMTVCVHGGHNFAKHLDVTGYDPVNKRLLVEKMSDTVYDKTKYALLNSVRLIDVEGEFALHKNADGTTRVYVWPDTDRPEGISYSVSESAFTIKQQSHLEVNGFKIERYAGGKTSPVDIINAKQVRVRNCEISMCAGVAGIHAVGSEDIQYLNNNIHHLPVKTRGLRFEAGKHCDAIGNTIYKPTGTALTYVNTKGGRCSQNEVSAFLGMHSNGLTFYVENEDLLIDRNYVHSGKGNVPLTIQTATNCQIRNNILDGDGGICLGIWVSQPFKDIVIEHNTIVNGDPTSDWKTGIFSNNKGPENLVIRNNIVDGVSGNLPATFQNNIYLRLNAKQTLDNLESGSVLVKDQSAVIDSNYKLVPQSVAINAATGSKVAEDFGGTKRPLGKAADIGAYELE